MSKFEREASLCSVHWHKLPIAVPFNRAKPNPIPFNSLQSNPNRTEPNQSNPIRTNPIQCQPIQSNPSAAAAAAAGPSSGCRQQVAPRALACACVSPLPVAQATAWTGDSWREQGGHVARLTSPVLPSNVLSSPLLSCSAPLCSLPKSSARMQLERRLFKMAAQMDGNALRRFVVPACVGPINRAIYHLECVRIELHSVGQQARSRSPLLSAFSWRQVNSLSSSPLCSPPNLAQFGPVEPSRAESSLVCLSSARLGSGRFSFR